MESVEWGHGHFDTLCEWLGHAGQAERGAITEWLASRWQQLAQIEEHWPKRDAEGVLRVGTDRLGITLTRHSGQIGHWTATVEAEGAPREEHALPSLAAVLSDAVLELAPAGGRRLGALIIDPIDRRVFNGRGVEILTPMESGILWELAREPNAVRSTDELRERLATTVGALRRHVVFLKRKLGPEHSRWIVSRTRVGYVLLVPGCRRADYVFGNGDCEIDLRGRIVRVAGRDCGLSKIEFGLVSFMARSPGRAYSREELIEAVWGGSAVGPTVVDQCVHRTTSKMRRYYFEPVRRHGYRFVTEPARPWRNARER